ncbi:hypothetical protein ACIBBD_33335 [Streptomyces sp. NPDC051315]|uniref:hypothetical protein n=1 Tax=Streptomyces sp. NPDC051315 TaxID=3365650 RepID=UPI0037B5D78D
MIRTVRALPALLLTPVLLAACGTQDADAADPAELTSRARALGVAPELVHTTEAPGYTLAQQSVGVYGGDGFSATYVSRRDGTHLTLTVDRGTMTAGTCPTQPPADSSGTPATCTRDGDAWYRGGAGGAEYVLPRKGFLIRIGGEGVPRDVLREAAHQVHRPTPDELDTLLPPAPAGGTPVERGDLPPAGDGAPDNDVDAGG